MRWIIESSMRLRFLVIILAVMLLVFGSLQLRQMPMDVYPEVAPPHVEIQTEAIGLSAQEVEAFITVPLEADLLNGVAWLDQIHSESVAGLSSVLLIFEPGTDPIRARQMVQERLTQSHALPNVSQPPVMIQPLSSTNRVMMVGLSSDELSLIELGVLSRWTIKPRLLGVPGVANVAIWGQRERQLQVLVDPEILHEQGLTLRQIIETTGEALWVSPLSYLEASSPGTAGWIDTPNQRLTIQHLLPITTPEDLARVVVAGAQGTLLGDVTTVVEDHQPLIGDAVLADGPGLILVIEKFPGANTLEVTRGVERAFTELQAGLPGVEVDTSLFRPANYIETAVDNLSTLVIIGLVLVALTFFIFYFDWRPTLISLATLALSLIAAGLVLFIGGATFNMMMWAGLVLALAIIIDNSIVDMERISKRLAQDDPDQGDDKSSMALILTTMLEVRSPLGFALLIVLLLVLPIFFLPGLSGAFFQPLVVTYVLAIITSLLVALIVTPALSVSLLPAGSLRRPSPVAQGLQGIYRRLLGRIVHSAPLALIVAAVFIVIGLILAPFLDVSLLPALKQDTLLIELAAAPGTSGPEMNRITAQASDELRAIPGVLNVGAHVGRAITGDAVVGINSGELWIRLDPAADYEAAVAAIQEVISGYPGLANEVQTYQPERIEEVLTGSDNDLVVRVYGHDLDLLRQKAQDVATTIMTVDGIADVQPMLYEEEPQVEIVVDLAAAEQHGIKPGDVRRQVTTLLSGIYVGNLFEEQKVFDVVVWGVPELRQNLTNINELMIDTPAGNQIALSEVADVQIAPAATVIQRDAVSRYVDVVANVNGRSLGAVTADIESRLQGIDVPFEFHVKVLSDSQAVQTNQRRLLTITIATLIGVYLLMQAAFSSWRLTFLLFLTWPMALVGGVVAVFITGGVLSIGSLFGFFALLAVAVRNGFVTIHHLQKLAQGETKGVRSELVLDGTQERLTPILMTAVATGLALLPLLLGGNIAGNELVRPMAAVILGGLVSSTILNLFVVPALYLRWPGTVPAPMTTPAGTQPIPEVA